MVVVIAESFSVSMKRFFLSAALTLIAFSLCAADYTIISPDGRIELKVKANNHLSANVSYNGLEYLQLPSIKLVTDKMVLGDRIHVRKVSRQSENRTLTPPYGINSRLHEAYNSLTLDCNGKYSVEFRAYNEGIAWRYVTRFGQTIKIEKEDAEFRFANNYKVYFHPSMSESDYRIQKLSDCNLQPNYSSMPVLVKPDEKTSILIHESAVSDYPCMSLYSSPDSPNTLKSIHPQLPAKVEKGGHKNFNLVVEERNDYIAETSGTRTFPWRIVSFAGNDKDILDNQIVWLLAEENKLQDWSWIKPGKVVWDWWNGVNLWGVDFEAGINTRTYKHFIDFAARHGIEYINLDEGWSDRFNLLKPQEGVDMEELSSYARSRGVGLFLWCVWHTLDSQMQEAMTQFEKWGIAGLKVDFMDRDDQLVVDFQERALQMAAKYHLLVNFHGAYHPNGLDRTYPNCINVEGVKGLEWNKIDTRGASPEGAATIPFIRMFAGPMDYTPGAMNNYNKDEWRLIKTRPMSQGTRCQQLAMYIVYYAPLQMISDSPSSYESEPAYLKFLSSIPTVWDETVPLQSKVGEYANIARRSGRTWFIGGLTNWTGRTFIIRTDFLEDGETYLADIVSDGVNAHRVGSDYKITRREIQKGDTIKLKMAPGGGYAIKFTPRSIRHDIVMFGDSRTQMGGDWTKKIRRKNVINAGFGGFTTSHFIWLVKPHVIDRHPSVCFLQGGSNDIGAGIPLERIEKNYIRLVDSLMAYNIKVVMHTVTYPNEKNAETQEFKVEMTDKVNEVIRRLADQRGLPLIDLNPLLTENKRLREEYAIDNVHFTPAGYTVWAGEIDRILEENNW